MNDYFLQYLDWIIDQVKDGSDIKDILDIPFSGSVNDYYCPECGPYVLAGVETYLKYAESIGGIPINCCININASTETYLKSYEAIGGPTLYCCTQDKFCIEDYFTPPQILNILDKGVVEQSSSSEIYKTNLCYLFEQLDENFIKTEVFDLFDAILDKGIVIWCEEGNIYATSVEEYLKLQEEVSIG